MKFLSLAFLILTTSAFASEVVLTCSTPGDGLDHVELVKEGQAELIKIYGLDESVDTYVIRSSLKNIAKGDSDTLIGVKSESEDFGGAVTEAVLMRVSDGQKKAFLARGGVVYSMNCTK